MSQLIKYFNVSMRASVWVPSSHVKKADGTAQISNSSVGKAEELIFGAVWPASLTNQ